MEEVLIYRGFEEQNINSENIKTIKVNKTKEEPKENITYTVQIATYGNKVNIGETFKGLSNVFFKKTDNNPFQTLFTVQITVTFKPPCKASITQFCHT